jgi:hypothetical protein
MIPGSCGVSYPTAMGNIVAAARDHGGPHVILQGSLGAGDNIKLFPQAPLGPMAATLAAKGEAEQVLADSGLPRGWSSATVSSPGRNPRHGQGATQR